MCLFPVWGILLGIDVYGHAPYVLVTGLENLIGHWCVWTRPLSVYISGLGNLIGQETRASSAIHNVAYKYNLLLVLKILSYSLYNNWTDEMQAVARNSVCACVWIQTGYILTIHNNIHEAGERLCKGEFTENVPTGSERCKVCIDASKRKPTRGWDGGVGAASKECCRCHHPCHCNIDGFCSRTNTEVKTVQKSQMNINQV